MCLAVIRDLARVWFGRPNNALLRKVTFAGLLLVSVETSAQVIVL
jgi:hypothetical protein